MRFYCIINEKDNYIVNTECNKKLEKEGQPGKNKIKERKHLKIRLK